jgi:hypothetical protein
MPKANGRQSTERLDSPFAGMASPGDPKGPQEGRPFAPSRVIS